MRLGLFAAHIVLAFVVVTASAASADTIRERGAYLVNVLAACGGCHTPKSTTGPGPALSGGSRYGSPESAVYAPNITPDKATGIGNWSDAQIADAIRKGVRPDGSRIGPPMPQTAYHAMSNADVQAIVVYLRSVAPVAHAVPSSARKMPQAATRIPSAAPGLRQADDPVGQGRYIATALSHCTECHTPMPRPVSDAAAHLDEGGRLFRTPTGSVVAPGIRARDLIRFTDGQLVAIITKGVRPDGSKIEGPMPVRSYAGYRSADLQALLAFLRSDQP